MAPTRPPGFDHVYRELFPTIFRVAYRIAGERGLAEDLTHEAFVQLLKRDRPLPDLNDAKYWLLRVVRNLSLNLEKRRARERRAVGRLEQESPRYANAADDAVLADETRNAVQEALNALPHAMRTIVVLREYAGLSYRHIAQVLGITEGNVKVRLFRARKELAARLSEGVNDRVS